MRTFARASIPIDPPRTPAGGGRTDVHAGVNDELPEIECEQDGLDGQADFDSEADWLDFIDRSDSDAELQ